MFASKSPPYKGGDAALKAQLGWSLTLKCFGASDHPGAPFLEAAPYRACAVAPPLLCKAGNWRSLAAGSPATVLGSKLARLGIKVL